MKTKSRYLKTVVAAALFGAVLYGLFLTGTYNPYDELAMLSVERASAELDVPVLTVPGPLETPELEIPTLETPELETPELEVPELDVPALTAVSVQHFCNVSANFNEIKEGGSVTISWDTEGYDTITLNGDVVSDDAGQKTFTNVQNDTTYTLTAKTDDGNHNCTETVVVTCIPDEPEVPQQPECPYNPDDNRVIIDFGDTRLMSDRGDSKAYSDIISTSLDAGTYSVKLVSWDGYIGRENVTQPLEQWIGVLFNGSTEVARTSEIKDVPDMVRQATVKEEVESNLVLTSAVNGVQAEHFYIGGGKTPNSVVPICAVFDKEPEEPEDASCDAFSVTPQTVDKGDVVTIAWETTNATKVVIDNGIGEVAEDGSTTATVNVDTTYTMTVYGTNGQSVTCTDSVVVNPDEPEAPVCPLTEKDGRTILDFTGRLRSDRNDSKQTNTVAFTPAAGNYEVTLVSWDGYNDRVNVTQPNESWKLQFLGGDTVLTTSGVIGDLEDMVREALKIEKVNTELAVPAGVTAVRGYHAVYPDNSSPNSVEPICAAVDEIPEEPAPSCDAFVATPDSIFAGDDVTLSWSTTNATRVVINNGVGEVDADGSTSVSPLDDTTYVMTVFGTESQSVTCEVPVTIKEEETDPQCVSLTASPTTLSFEGGTTTLAWETKNAETVTLSGVGTVAKNDSLDIFVDAATTFTLTVADADATTTCSVAVELEPEPEPLTCASDVTFTISDTKVDEGDSITLDWDVTDRIDTVSIDQGIGSVNKTGSRSMSVDNDTTYTLTATAGNETVTCPVRVEVDEGGGGGGSSSPRCELEISDTRIMLGEEVTISWDTSRATEVTLEDDRGNTIFTTDDFLRDEKDDWYDGSITVKPTRDTEYTLTAERGSRDRECEVKVRVEEDEIVVIEQRIEPLVAGIALTQVPYTGFEAGPILTMLFYLMLMAWALYMAYILVIKYQLFGVEMAGPAARLERPSVADRQVENFPELFVKAVVPPAPTAVPAASVAPVADTTPVNLPVAPTVGYETMTEETEIQTTEPTIADVTTLENYAHELQALVSSDALAHLMEIANDEKRAEALECVVAAAKVKYPTEDGWMVLNQSRMESLCMECLTGEMVKKQAVKAMPSGSGSLAEAILTGNIAGAYALIGNRPMVSVANAASDLDAVYRARKSGDGVASDLLKKAVATLSDEQIHDAMVALTGALDGTYSTEEEAVKMAIMKAVKAVA